MGLNKLITQAVLGRDLTANMQYAQREKYLKRRDDRQNMGFIGGNGPPPGTRAQGMGPRGWVGKGPSPPGFFHNGGSSSPSPPDDEDDDDPGPRRGTSSRRGQKHRNKSGTFAASGGYGWATNNSHSQDDDQSWGSGSGSQFSRGFSRFQDDPDEDEYADMEGPEPDTRPSKQRTKQKRPRQSSASTASTAGYSAPASRPSKSKGHSKRTKETVDEDLEERGHPWESECSSCEDEAAGLIPERNPKRK